MHTDFLINQGMFLKKIKRRAENSFIMDFLLREIGAPKGFMILRGVKKGTWEVL